jgi:hypothetical protein
VYVTDKPKHISRKEKREHLKESGTTNKRRELIQQTKGGSSQCPIIIYDMVF